MIVNNITDLIGNTPLLRIPESIHGFEEVEIFAKLEYMNPFGSIKDRTALSLLSDYTPGKIVIESSSGNTAKALASILSIQGEKLLTVTNRIKIESIGDMLRILGSEIQELPPGGECPDPSDPNSPYQAIQSKLRSDPDMYYWTAQYKNRL